MKYLSDNLVKVSSILSDLNFHDGDAIGSKLNITRAAIWKIIKKLEEYGIEVNSIKNKGYSLHEPLLLLDKEKIVHEIANPNIPIDIFESIDSTNNFLKKNLFSEKRRIAISEYQTQGRGRMGRNWQSPFGKNIYLSLSYLFDKDVSELHGLSLVVGIAVINAIKEIGITEPMLQLKWPNDGVYQGKKFMGNLVELLSESHGYTKAVIGIGINVNMDSNSDIEQEWVSLKQIINKYIDRNILCISLIHNLNYSLEQFEKYGLTYFTNQWQELDSVKDSKISLNNQQITGIAKGVDQFGNLLIDIGDGNIKNFSSGEVTFSNKTNPKPYLNFSKP